jgi:hypothetical protein
MWSAKGPEVLWIQFECQGCHRDVWDKTPLRDSEIPRPDLACGECGSRDLGYVATYEVQKVDYFQGRERRKPDA